MSPEQAEGGNVDGRSDLYSLGIVLYECITGTVPFRSDNNNPVITLHKIIHDPLTSPKSINNNIPAWLDSILCKVLEKNRNYRFNNGAELVSALKNRQEVKISPPTVKYNRTTVPKQKLSSQKPSSSKELLRPHWFTATFASKAIIYTIGMLAIILLIIIIWNNINSQNNTFSTKTPPITEKIIQPEVQKMAINQTQQTEEKQSPKPEITKQANEPEKPNKEKPKTEKQQKPEETVEKTSVPSVIGRQFSVAQAVIYANGFNVGSINYVDDPSRKGIVLKQIPPSGVEIKPGSSINLIIGK
jgi:serine/threonine-protein kinase